MSKRAEEIINEYYRPGSKSHRVLVEHGGLVAAKALKIARRVSHLNPDPKLVEEAAWLHDIGIFMTKAPSLGCAGEHPYVVHGLLGRRLLEKHNLTDHSLICERHMAAGITAKEIEHGGLPLPVRDMLPITVEEKIICLADKFYSKNPETGNREKSTAEIKFELGQYGKSQVERFEAWQELFGIA